MCIKNWIMHYTVIFILQRVMMSRSNANKLMQNIPLNSSSEVDDMKYILLWEAKGTFKNMFGEGKETFLQNDCPVDNCFISINKYMFGGDLKKFDAILFNGWDQKWYERGVLPDKRYYHQKYAYVQRESAARAYVCHSGFDDFFNWTITYKLDSDIIFPHIHVRDINDDIVGPRKDMHWVTDMLEVDATLTSELESKKKAAAWFYIDCEPSTLNRKFIEHLERSLNKYGLKIDVYGKCGPLHCPMHECDQLLDKDYYFYLAIEESFADDYVTGNILRALRNNVVPVVYGGAKYSKFLPPESYLDGTAHSPDALAAIMLSLVKNHTLYSRYLRWKSHYSYCLGPASPSLPLEGLNVCSQTMCDLCQALHDPSRFDIRAVYKDFRKWWYPNYVAECDKQRTANTSADILKQREEENEKKMKKEEYFKQKRIYQEKIHKKILSKQKKRNKKYEKKEQKIKDKQRKRLSKVEKKEKKRHEIQKIRNSKQGKKKKNKQRKKKISSVQKEKKKMDTLIKRKSMTGNRGKKNMDSQIARKSNINKEKKTIINNENEANLMKKTKGSTLMKENNLKNIEAKNYNNLVLTEENEAKNKPLSAVKGRADLLKRLTDQLALRKSAQIINKTLDASGGSHGGGGGGASRTAGAMAMEFSRCKASLLTNNFEINKR